MKISFERGGDGLQVRLQGRLDASSLPAEFWNDLRDELRRALEEAPGVPVYFDLREMDYADSRSAHHLQELGEDLAPWNSVVYLGPGPGMGRLEELGNVPHLAPMLPQGPGEETDELLEPVAGVEGQEAHDDELSGLDELIGHEELFGHEEPIGNEEPDPEFVIDLDREATYLQSRSDHRDHIVVPGSLEFRDDWQTVSRPESSSGSPREDAGSHLPDPAELLLRSAADAPVLEDHPKSPSPARGSPQRHLDPDSRASALGPVATSESANPTADVSRSEAVPSDSMLAGVGELVRTLGRVEEEKTELTERCEAWRQRAEDAEARAAAAAGAVRAARERLQDLQRHETDRERSWFQLALDRWSWLAALEVKPIELAQLQNAWGELVQGFESRGQATPAAILRLVDRLVDASTGLAAAVGDALTKRPGVPGALRWRALMIFLSTLVREGRSRDERRAALVLATVAALVDRGPGRRAVPGECSPQLEGWVERVVRAENPSAQNPSAAQNTSTQNPSPQDSGLARFCQRMPLPETLSLWRAVVALAARPELEGRHWSESLGAVTAAAGAQDPQRPGLARIVDAHSFYLPGSWVELTTGGIGPVLGAQPGRPEQPRVLVLFRVESGSPTSIRPQLFPMVGEEAVSVRRVLDQPRLGLEPYSTEQNSSKPEGVIS